MNTRIKNSFWSNLKKITDPTVKAEIKGIISTVQQAATTNDIPEMRKLKGCKKGISYRIKVGNSYRIGVTIEGGLVTFVIFMHRKDIYRHFP